MIILESFIIEKGLLIAAFSGTVLSLSYVPKMSCFHIFVYILYGTLTGIYIPPLLIDYGLFNQKVEASLGFICGFSSNIITPSIIKGTIKLPLESIFKTKGKK